MEILRLPVDRWREYRDLRLRALKDEPEAFSSSHAASLDLLDESWKKRLTDALQGERSWLLFAKENDKLVGVVGAFVEETSTDTATIVSLYVPKEERRKGISARLMQEILTELAKKSFLTKARLAVYKHQLPAVSLYRKLGFKEIGVELSTTGAGNLAEQLIMEGALPR